MSTHRPIEEEHRAMLNALAKGIDRVLNDGEEPKKLGFALLIYNFGEDLTGTGRINYIGNGERGQVLAALKELVARWEGRYAEPGDGRQ